MNRWYKYEDGRLERADDTEDQIKECLSEHWHLWEDVIMFTHRYYECRRCKKRKPHYTGEPKKEDKET